MLTPSKIYIDPRVAAVMKTEPASDIDSELCYLSQAYVEELLRDVRQETMSMIPSERVVQLSNTQAGVVLALTNLGRIFGQFGPGIWDEFPGPALTHEDRDGS